MNAVIFENAGEIDLRTISTFGCSVKETSNPIGFFGTGLKYALAVLIRTGHAISIQSGKTVTEIISRKEEIRGKEFDFICGVCDSVTTPLGFTTELGKNWLPWMAYRELYCNANDEHEGRIYSSGEVLEPQGGKTRVIVTGAEILAIFNNSSEFILKSQPLAVCGVVEVHAGETSSLFYRGIKVGNFEKPALFTYNITEHTTLTEDRTVSDIHSCRNRIGRALSTHGEKAVLEKILIASNGNIESHFDYHGWGDVPCDDFLETIGTLQRSSLMLINQTAVRVWREKTGNFIEPRRISLTRVQGMMLQKAIDFCEKAGYKLRDEYPILVVESLGSTGVLAVADRFCKRILLTERIFQEGGTKGVARALMEEYIHLRFNVDDESRAMQNLIFDKMISLAEELQGEPL